MSDIFISHSSDIERVQELAAILRGRGWSVWWDDQIRIGDTWRNAIKNELDSARCIIVLWSATSVKSNYVNAEASEGSKRGILMPAMIDEVEIPLEFRSAQTARLTDWRGTTTHPGLNKLLQSVSELLGGPVEGAQSLKDLLEKRIRELYSHIGSDEKTSRPVDPLGDSASATEDGGYPELVRAYLGLYLAMCRRLPANPASDIVDLAVALSELDAGRRSKERRLADSSWPELDGSRIIRVDISQVFRLADVLTHPESVKARKLYEAFTDANQMRRALNQRKGFKLGTLGSLRPVTRIGGSEGFDNFWKIALPELRLKTDSPLCFIPYELTLSKHLEELRCEPDSVLELDSLRASDKIANLQVGGYLRIYPPGIGVISLGLTLEFKKAIHIGMVAQIARDVEGLLFVDPSGSEKPYETVMLEIVDQVIKQLFTKGGLSYEERRYRPPTTTFSFRDDNGFKPNDRVNELAYLMSTAPGNQEEIQDLRNRVQNALREPDWRAHQVMAVAGQGVAVFFIADSFAKGKKKKRESHIEWLRETHELVSVAAYAEQSLSEEIDFIFRRGLDDNWLPQNKDNFCYLSRLLQTLRQVMRAIAAVRWHLEHRRAPELMTFSKRLWTYSDPVDRTSLHQGLTYIADWLAASLQSGTERNIADLLRVLKDIQNMPAPFRGQIDKPDATAESTLKELDAQLLTQLRQIDQVLEEGGSEGLQQITERLRVMERHYRQS
jgi:hypothetical protein